VFKDINQNGSLQIGHLTIQFISIKASIIINPNQLNAISTKIIPRFDKTFLKSLFGKVFMFIQLL